MTANNDILAGVEGLVEALEQLARLGNGDTYGNSTGNVIAQQALATAPALLERVRAMTEPVTQAEIDAVSVRITSEYETQQRLRGQHDRPAQIPGTHLAERRPIMTPLETIIKRLEAEIYRPIHPDEKLKERAEYRNGVRFALAVVREELSKPVTPDQLQQLGKALYEIEPFMVSDMPMPWEKLEPEVRAKCVRYASVMMAAWQKMGGGE